MNEEAIEALLNQARRSPRVIGLAEMRHTGAEGYFQSLYGMVAAQQAKTVLMTMYYAMRYLRVTATDWENPEYRKGAAIARRVFFWLYVKQRHLR